MTDKKLKQPEKSKLMSGEKNHRYRKDITIEKIIKMRTSWMSLGEIAKYFNTDYGTIQRRIKRHRETL